MVVLVDISIHEAASHVIAEIQVMVCSEAVTAIRMDVATTAVIFIILVIKNSQNSLGLHPSDSLMLVRLVWIKYE